MVSMNFRLCLAAAAVLAGSLAPDGRCTGVRVAQASTKAVHKHHKPAARRKHSGVCSRYRYGSYFVPPPPAYMPSILPELRTADNIDSPEPPRPADPSSRYVFYRDKSQSPAAVRPNKYVTYYNSKS